MQLHKSEILIISAIIAASYLFSLDEIKFLDTQLLFILITLGIVIIYKLMYIQKINKINENFVSIPLNGLSQYVSEQDSKESNFVKIEDYNQLKNKLEKLQKEIGTMYQRGGNQEKKNSIKELIHDSNKIDKKIKERTQEIEELKSMIIAKQNEDRATFDKIKYEDSSAINMNSVNSNSFTNTRGSKSNTSPVSNSINIKDSFKNMISDADGGITEFRNTGNIKSNGVISNIQNTNAGGNSANKQNKSQIAQLLNHIKKNGIKVSI